MNTPHAASCRCHALNVVFIAIFFLTALGLGGTALAQIPTDFPGVTIVEQPASDEVFMRADSVGYTRGVRVMEGEGNVRIEYEGTVLTADNAALDRETKEVYATGNVIVTQPDGQSYRFQELTYDLTTGDLPQQDRTPPPPPPGAGPTPPQGTPPGAGTPPPGSAYPGAAPVNAGAADGIPPPPGASQPPPPSRRPVVPAPSSSIPAGGPSVGAGGVNTGLRPGLTIPNVQLAYYPFTIKAKEGNMLDRRGNHVRLQNAMITSCPVEEFATERPEFYMLADEVEVFDKEIIRAKNARFFFEGRQFWKQPTYTLDLKRDHTNYDFLPGYASREGAFLKNAYTWYPSENWNTTSHLDYRTKRGFAFGQSARWSDRVTEADKDFAAEGLQYGREDRNYIQPEPQWRGRANAYFAFDDEPYRNEDQEARERALGIDIDEERYRWALSHTHNLTDNDYLYIENNVWSDVEITKDFFNQEYRLMPVPENRLNLVHYDRAYTLGLEVNKQFNDEDFSNINRLPELTFNVFQQPILDTGLYYDTFTSAGRYEAVFSDRAKAGGAIDFDTERFHTGHTLSYPMKYFGWLNLIPRASVFGTYYGDTFDSVNRVTSQDVLDSNGVVIGSTNVTTSGISNLGDDFRLGAQFDLETSFKMSKVLHEDMRDSRTRGLRHIVEPYTRFTYVPEPDLRPFNLFQFDAIDQFDRRNDVTFGVRNKLQTKRYRPGVRNVDGSPLANVEDLLDVNVFATAQLDPEDDDAETLSLIFTDLEYRAADWIRADVRAAYDPEESEFSQVNSTVQFTNEDFSYLSLTHVFRPDIYNSLNSAYGLFPQEKFSVYGFGRYSFEESLLEEIGVLATYKTDCIGYGIGGNWISGDFFEVLDDNDEDEWKIYFQMWLLQFPNSPLRLGL